MPPRKRATEPAPLLVKEFTPEEIERGIARLNRRIEEVKALDPAGIRYDDQKSRTAEQNIRSDILEVFGPQSPENRDHQYHTISHGQGNVADDDADRQRQFADGIPQTLTMLRGLVAKLEERKAEQSQSPANRARAMFEGLELHPRIAAVATIKSSLRRAGMPSSSPSISS